MERKGCVIVLFDNPSIYYLTKGYATRTYSFTNRLTDEEKKNKKKQFLSNCSLNIYKIVFYFLSFIRQPRGAPSKYT